MVFLGRFLTDSFVEKRYIEIGKNIGNIISMIYMGEPEGFKKIVNKWEKWEEEYASRGFRTLSLNQWENIGGWEDSIEGLIGQIRNKEETPIYHAKIYKQKFLGKIKPSLNIEQLLNSKSPISKSYFVPSTTETTK